MAVDRPMLPVVVIAVDLAIVPAVDLAMVPAVDLARMPDHRRRTRNRTTAEARSKRLHHLLEVPKGKRKTAQALSSNWVRKAFSILTSHQRHRVPGHHPLPINLLLINLRSGRAL
jgi:hypothetical protein